MKFLSDEANCFENNWIPINFLEKHIEIDLWRYPKLMSQYVSLTRFYREENFLIKYSSCGKSDRADKFPFDTLCGNMLHSIYNYSSKIKSHTWTSEFFRHLIAFVRLTGFGSQNKVSCRDCFIAKKEKFLATSVWLYFYFFFVATVLSSVCFWNKRTHFQST